VRRYGPGRSADGKLLGIFEIILFLVIALIVIPPDDLPQVMRAAGKILRELRLASNTVMREISGAIGEDSPFNLLPPRFDDPHPPAVPPVSPSPPPPAFLAPGPQSQPPPESAPATQAASAPQASAANPRATGELTPADRQAQVEPQPPGRPREPEQPSLPENSMPPADKP
jgi:sec-independent protein translocase protein TatB